MFNGSSIKPEVLIVDDELHFLDSVRDLLRKDYTVFVTADPEEALRLIECENIALILCDQRMPKLTGVELLTKAAAIKPETIRVLVTGYSDIDAVVKAINEGKLFHYLSKPFDRDRFLKLVQEATDTYACRTTQHEMIRALETLNEPASSGEMQLGELAKETDRLTRDNQILQKTLKNLNDSNWFIRRLQHVLPICMTCSKVRLEEGGWMDISKFLNTYSNFLSHSYCPDCAEIAKRELLNEARHLRGEW